MQITDPLEAVARWSRDAYWLFFLNDTVLKLRNKLWGTMVKFCFCVALQNNWMLWVGKDIQRLSIPTPWITVKGQKHPIMQLPTCKGQFSISGFWENQFICQIHRGGKEGRGGDTSIGALPISYFYKNLLRMHLILSSRSLKKTLIGIGSSINL